MYKTVFTKINHNCIPDKSWNSLGTVLKQSGRNLGTVREKDRNVREKFRRGVILWPEKRRNNHWSGKLLALRCGGF
jgi:hypothetical protein